MACGLWKRQLVVSGEWLVVKQRLVARRNAVSSQWLVGKTVSSQWYVVSGERRKNDLTENPASKGLWRVACSN